MKHPGKTLGLIAAIVAVAVSAWLIAPLAVTSAQPRSAAATAGTHAGRFTSVPVTGTTRTGGRFVGTLDIRRFGVFKGTIKAVGDLSGKVKNASGRVVGTVLDREVRGPVASIDGTPAGTLATTRCTILHLVLGPIHL